MPGLLLCFVMRYDKYKKQAAVAADTEQARVTYFHCSLIGYIVGKFWESSMALLVPSNHLVKESLKRLINAWLHLCCYDTLHPNINMHFLLTVCYTFPWELTRRICCKSESFFSRLSCRLF